ncbi:MAG: IclR family transcriptional regulator [Alphaproteobacteria bacterium]|nr:IclR family transcriptional regulator [Alphaproteobacteria bacterium]
MSNKTLLKGLRLIESLVQMNGQCGVSELSRELRLPKSNVHRVLETLVEGGYARNDPATGRYSLTLRLWELGSCLVSRVELRPVAAPHLRALARGFDETVHLSVLDDGEVIYLDIIEAEQPVRAYTRVGGRAPASCVATGKALLAFQGTDAIARAIARLEPHTATTIVEPDRLVAELERIRRDGIAFNHGEWRASVCGVAAPIRDSAGTVVAAVGISGPSSRLTPERMIASAATVMATARAISHDLGYIEPPAPAARPPQRRDRPVSVAVPR